MHVAHGTFFLAALMLSALYVAAEQGSITPSDGHRVVQKYVFQMEGTNDEVRKAIEQMGDEEQRQLLDRLAGALGSGATMQAKRAAWVVPKLRVFDERIVPSLLKYIPCDRQPDWGDLCPDIPDDELEQSKGDCLDNHLGSVLEVLGALGPRAKAALPCLLSLIQRSDVRSAYLALAHIVPDSPKLRKKTKQLLRKRKWWALDVVRVLGPKASWAGTLLLKQLRTGPSRPGRQPSEGYGPRDSVVEVLCRVRHPEKAAVDTVIRILHNIHEPTSVRESAACGLHHFRTHTKTRVNALVKALDNRNPELANVRSCAAMSLGLIGQRNQKVRSALVRALNLDEKSHSGPRAAFALAALGAVDALNEALQQSSPVASRNVKGALKQIRSMSMDKLRGLGYSDIDGFRRVLDALGDSQR
jgi:hypothetical protein